MAGAAGTEIVSFLRKVETGQFFEIAVDGERCLLQTRWGRSTATPVSAEKRFDSEAAAREAAVKKRTEKLADGFVEVDCEVKTPATKKQRTGGPSGEAPPTAAPLPTTWIYMHNPEKNKWALERTAQSSPPMRYADRLAPTSPNFTLCARRWYDLECSGLSVKIHFGGCAKGKGSCHPKVFGDAAEATGYARGKVNAQGKKGFAVVEASKRPAA